MAGRMLLACALTGAVAGSAAVAADRPAAPAPVLSHVFSVEVTLAPHRAAVHGSGGAA